MAKGMEIFSLFGSILVDNSKANESISKTEKNAEGLGTKLGNGIKTAAKWGAAIGAGAIAAGTALYGLATKAAESTDRIDKMSQKIGISRQGFQEWDFILSQSGTDVEKLQVGLKTMVQRMDETAKGTGQGAEMFKKLGVTVTDSTGAMKSQEQVFEETVRALQGMPEGAEKSRLAFELFGKAGTELMPMLNGTTGSIDEMKEMAHKLGIVLSDDAVDAGVQFTDTVDQLKRSFGAVTTQVGTAVMPIMQKFAEWIIANMPTIQRIIGAVFNFLKTYVDIAVQAIGWLVDAFNYFFDSTKDSSDEFMYYFEVFKTWFMDLFEVLKELVFASLEAIKVFWDKHGEEIIAVAKAIWDVIYTFIGYAMEQIKTIIQIATALISGDWEAAWDGVKQLFVNAWEYMKEILPKLLDGLYKVMKASFSIFKEIGKSMFNFVWEGMKSIWESISNWVSDKVDWLVDKLTFWKKTQDKMSGGGAKTINGNVVPSGSHAGGLAYVPYDGYIAELHRGERVLTAAENRAGAGMTININGANIMDDYGVDRLMDRVIERLALQGVR